MIAPGRMVMLIQFLSLHFTTLKGLQWRLASLQSEPGQDYPSDPAVCSETEYSGVSPTGSHLLQGVSGYSVGPLALVSVSRAKPPDLDQ